MNQKKAVEDAGSFFISDNQILTYSGFTKLYLGGDFERAKMLQKTALDLERKEAKKARKSNKDPGFTSWADNTARQYNKLTKGVAPDWERYEREKAEMGDDFYANSGTAAILPGRLKEPIIFDYMSHNL